MCKSISTQHSLVSVSTHHFERFLQGFVWYILIPKKALSFHGKNERLKENGLCKMKHIQTTLAGLTDFGVGKKKKNP